MKIQYPICNVGPMNQAWLVLLFVLIGAMANSSAAASANTVESDAQQYTQLVLRHDRLILKNNMKRPMSKAEFEEMGRLRAEFQTIRAKYAAGGASRSLAAAYDKRVKELSAELVAPAVKRWIAEEFPEPDQVAAAYPNELQCSAALQVLHDVLKEKVGQPPTPEVTAKILRYENAWTKINPRSRADYTSRLLAIEKFLWSKPFRFEVLSKFVPLYSVEAGNAARKIAFDTNLATAKARVNSANLAIGLLVLALPLLYLLRGERGAHPRRSRNPDEAYPFQLPRSLETLEVFRKSIPVEFVCGKVTYKDVWKETTTWTTTTPGQTRESGPWTFKDPDTSSTHTKTETFYQYTFQTPEGTTQKVQFQWTATDLEVGQLFSMVTSGAHVLLYFNHTKGDRLGEGDSLKEVLAMRPGFWFWLASMIVAVPGFLAVQRVLGRGVLLGDHVYENIAEMMILATAVLGGIYIAILRSKVRKFRERQFDGTWVPRFRKFMEDVTPSLTHHFGADDRQRIRLENRLEKRRTDTNA